MKPAAQWIEEYTRDKHTGNERLRQSRLEEFITAIQRDAIESAHGSASFDIYFPGEIGAGLRSFSDEVTVTCKSGQWGGEPGEFESYMRDCLKEWYDGATVTPNDKLTDGGQEKP